jgi:hypothetical protein
VKSVYIFTFSSFFIWSGSHKFYIQFLRQLGLQSFIMTLYFLTTIYQIINLDIHTYKAVRVFCTGISKIILVKGGHRLENVRLNLFRVFSRVVFHTLTNVINKQLTYDWLTSTFFMSQEPVSRNTPTQFVRHA